MKAPAGMFGFRYALGWQQEVLKINTHILAIILSRRGLDGMFSVARFAVNSNMPIIHSPNYSVCICDSQKRGRNISEVDPCKYDSFPDVFDFLDENIDLLEFASHSC